MYIQREIKQDIQKKLSQRKSKIVIIYGARQVGKTSLVEDILKFMNKKILRLNGDEAKTSAIFSSRSGAKIKSVVSGYDIVFIDEAQRIENIGINLKILHDSHPKLKVIVTGSSSFDLASSIQESLTGRSWVFHLYPISLSELNQTGVGQAEPTGRAESASQVSPATRTLPFEKGATSEVLLSSRKAQKHHFSKMSIKSYFLPYELKQEVENFLVFGSYPELFSLNQALEKKEYLHTLSENYLYKDILAVDGLRASQKIKKLLKLLAFQIGSEVSLTELSQRLEIHKTTVQRYVDLLEKFFVIFPLSGFSRNLRKELTKKPKIYFYDLGVRNAIIGNFNSLEDRNDVGALWENFIITERLKFNTYKKRFASSYFWRTYTGAELDYVEECEGRLTGYEIKWKKKAKAPKLWKENYQADFYSIHKDNFLSFISGEGVVT